MLMVALIMSMMMLDRAAIGLAVDCDCKLRLGVFSIQVGASSVSDETNLDDFPSGSAGSGVAVSLNCSPFPSCLRFMVTSVASIGTLAFAAESRT